MKLLKPLARIEERQSLTDYLSWFHETFSVGGNSYTLPYQTTMAGEKAEPISDTLSGYTQGGLKSNGVVFGLERVRVKVFSQGRFMYQRLNKGRPGDMFSTPELGLLERPWPGGTTADLMAIALLDADLAGNAYLARSAGQIMRLRPDWVEVILGERVGGVGGYSKAGYLYWHGGKGPGGDDPVLFTASEVCHFMPMPDPLYTFRGMSWLTPVIREIQSDGAATAHKLKFFENAATPNLAVSLSETVTPEQFAEFVEKMDSAHGGFENAYKTLYTGGGADVTVIGADMRQIDFKVTQGAGETRIALAAGIHPAVAALSEGMQGASLNAGNFSAARRQTGDIEFAHLWQNLAGSLEVLFPPPNGARLAVDKRDIPFLRDDEKDIAEIQSTRAIAIRQLVDAGYVPDSVVTAIDNDDLTLLKHSGLFSVQLQEPGAADPEPEPVVEPDPARGLEQLRDELRAASESRADPVVNLYPQVHVENHVPVPDVHVAAPTVNVAAPDVRVSPPEVYVAAPTVNVEAPGVNVTAPDVHVAAPTVNVAAPDVHVDVAAPDVTVKPPLVNVSAPEVRVDVAAPDVQVAAPTVNVAAPDVHVENQIQPADVHVSPTKVHVELPPVEKVTRRVVRDNKGNIVKVVEE